MGIQQDLFPADLDSGRQKLPDIVISKHTDLLEFGNRYDILIVRGDVVRGVSLLECDDEDVRYFNYQSPQESIEDV